MVAVAVNVSFNFKVVANSDTNRMNEQNLAIVFGPNLMWSKNQASLVSVGYVNTCTLFMISHYKDLFVK